MAHLLNGFKWIPGVATNIELTWRKHGYTPPSEQQEYQLKWKRFKENNHEHERIQSNQCGSDRHC